MGTVRVGFVGAGFMSQVAHILCFQRAVGAEVTALASARPQLLKQVADRFGIPKRYASYHELGADLDIDLAVVSVPPELNTQICLDLLAAGKHVFCEKPVALCAAEAQRLAEAAQRSGKHLLVGFMKRHDAGVQAAKAVTDRWFGSGEAGQALYARAHAFIGGDWMANAQSLFPVIRSEEPMGEKAASVLPAWLPEEYGGTWGPYYFFNHVHSHDMDLLAYFLGADFEVVFADWSRATKLAVLQFGGVPATLETAKAGNSNRWDEELTMYFEHGWVRVSLPPPLLVNVPARVAVCHLGERQEVCEAHAPYSWSFARQAQHAVDVVAGGAEPLCSISDGLVQVEMTEAIFRKVSGM